MNLRVIPIQIGSNSIEHCLNLVNKSDKENQRLTKKPTFILPYEAGGVCNLFNFIIPKHDNQNKYLKDLSYIVDSNSENEIYEFYPVLCQTDRGEEYVYIHNIEITSQKLNENNREPETINLDIYLADPNEHIKNNASYLTNELSNNNLLIKKDRCGQDSTDYKWRISYNPDEAKSTQFNITFHHIGTKKTLTICLNVCRNDLVSDIILDCGSDSTQYLRYDRNADDANTKPDNIQYIFDDMTNYYCGCKDIDETKILQFHEHNFKLFKSIYFYSPTFQNDDSIIHPSKKLKSAYTPEQCLYTLTTEDEAFGTLIKDNGFRILPLIKIPQGRRRNEDTDLFDAKDYYFFRSVVNQYIRCILNTFQKVHENPDRHIIINLLLPFSFKLERTARVLSLLSEDINEIIKDFSNITAIELRSIYESDAPAIGALEYLRHQEEPPQDGNYLLLDAGKSTLDISIINYKNNRYTCKYRTGTLGAGNTLTYAYLCALIADFLESKNKDVNNGVIQDYIFENIINQDSKHKFELHKQVEGYKKQHCVKMSLSEDEHQPQIVELLNYINKKTKDAERISETSKRYIDKYIDCIHERIIKLIKDIINSDEDKIHKVIFSGNAFKCKKFKENIITLLRDRDLLAHDVIDSNAELIYDIGNTTSVDAKKIALLIAYATSDGRYYNLPNMPLIKRAKKSESTSIKGIIASIFGNKTVFSISNKMKESPFISSRPNIALKEEDYYPHGLHHGFDILVKKGDRIYHNGQYFDIPDVIGTGRKKLFIVNDNFYIRTCRKNLNICLELKLRGFDFDEDTALKDATNFPNIDIDASENVPMPPTINEEAEPNKNTTPHKQVSNKTEKEQSTPTHNTVNVYEEY